MRPVSHSEPSWIHLSVTCFPNRINTRTLAPLRASELSPVPLLLFLRVLQRPKRGLSSFFDFKTAFNQSELPRCCVESDLDVAFLRLLSDGHRRRTPLSLSPRDLPRSARLYSPASDALSSSTLRHGCRHLRDHLLVWTTPRSSDERSALVVDAFTTTLLGRRSFTPQSRRQRSSPTSAFSRRTSQRGSTNPSRIEDFSSRHRDFTLSTPQLGPSSRRLARPLVTLPGFGSSHLSPVLISPSNSLGRGGNFALSCSASPSYVVS